MIGNGHELIVGVQIGLGLLRSAAQDGQLVGAVARCGGREFERGVLGGDIGYVGFGAVLLSGKGFDLHFVAGFESCGRSS